MRNHLMDSKTELVEKQLVANATFIIEFCKLKGF